MLVVDPYLVHAYWEVLPEHLRGVSEQVAGNRNTAKAVLRFHEIAGAEPREGGWFDVHVDLSARNWYVPLWSPNKRYYVDLGLAMNGRFAPLARSNPIRTPRAWPEEPLERRIETVGATQAAAKNGDGAEWDVKFAPPPIRPEPVRRRPAPTRVPALHIPAIAPPATPATPAETLQKRLGELHALRELSYREAGVDPESFRELLQMEPAHAEKVEAIEQGAGTPAGELLEQRPLDLTAMAERDLTIGVASMLLLQQI